ncbi:MAG TPA: septum formation initiator family protein [Terriglobales bacterium]|nr:septum formation initiator family protein [Terriglobales bacterium]
MSEKTAEDRLGAVWQQYGRAILAVLVVALLVHDVFGTHGFLAMQRTKKEMEQVQTDLDRLNKENQQLAEDVKALKTDPHKIESIARSELGLAKPGEVIIKIPPGQQAEQNPAPKP